MEVLVRKNNSPLTFAGLAVFTLSAAMAQTQDNSGNPLLKGSFRFRHVAILSVDSNNDPAEVAASYGTITFDGAGSYVLNGSIVDNTVNGGASQVLNTSGTYAIGSNGIGYIANPQNPADYNLNIWGAVSQGVYAGSATESQLEGPVSNDIFVAIPVTASAPSNASFTTSYQTGLLDFTQPGGAGSGGIKNALFELSPNGKGSFGAIAVSGQAVNQSGPLSQSITGATYNFTSDGSATLTVPTPAGIASGNALFSGTKTLYPSADGNFILGWTTGGYDIFFGVAALTAPAAASLDAGLYFTAALEDSQGGK